MRKIEVFEKMITLQDEHIDLLREEVERLRVQVAAAKAQVRQLAENLGAVHDKKES